MKLLCTLATVTFLSAQAYAGIILPELGRSKSVENSSPIAVGFSQRNSMNATLGYTFNNTENNGVDLYETTDKTGDFSVFYTGKSFNLEVLAGLNYGSKDYDAATTTDDELDGQDIKATGAMTMGNFTFGLSASAARSADKDSTTKDVTKNYVITPAAAMKIMPNIAVGVGINHVIDSGESIVVGGNVTEEPTLHTNEIFIGAAYGVDQKIGENGFGAEAVLSHRLKAEEKTKSEGERSTLTINGNFTQDMFDVKATVVAYTGKNYNKSVKSNGQAFLVRPEMMIASPFYVAPVGGFAQTKEASVKTKTWTYGLGFGMRTAMHDIELAYVRGSADQDPGTQETTANKATARYSFYF